MHPIERNLFRLFPTSIILPMRKEQFYDLDIHEIQEVCAV